VALGREKKDDDNEKEQQQPQDVSNKVR